MTIRIQILSIILLVLILLVLIGNVKRKKIDLRFSLAWFVLLVITLILAIFPKILYALADLVGIATPTNMLLFAGLILAMLIIYSLSVALSKITDQMRANAQYTAMLEKRVRELEINSAKEDK